MSDIDQLAGKGTFNRLPMTEGESVQGHTLSAATTKVIQNLIADDAEEALNLFLRIVMTEEQKIRAAICKGRIESLQYLLEVNRAILETPSNQS